MKFYGMIISLIVVDGEILYREAMGGGLINCSSDEGYGAELP